MNIVDRCRTVCVVVRLLACVAVAPLASAQGAALPERPAGVPETPPQGFFDPSAREWELFGDSAASPDKWLLTESALTQSLGRSGSIAQLLISCHTILRYDFLLQPNFFAAGPLGRLLGAAPKGWHEHVEQVGGKTVRVRDASITIPDGVRALTAAIHEEITTPRGKPVVLSTDSGAPPQDQRISASITVSLKSSTQICVCDVRDWMGFETRSEKGVLIYEFAPNDSQPIFMHKSARFTLRQETDSDSIRGQDLVASFTLAEEGG